MHRHKKPFIIRAAFAMTVDGKMADPSGHFHKWSSREDNLFLNSLVESHNILVIGEVTFNHLLRRKALPQKEIVVLSKKTRNQKGIKFVNPETDDLVGILKKLGGRTLVLGGLKTYSYFFSRNLIREFYMTLEPIMFGGGLPSNFLEKFSPRYFHLKKVERLNKKGSLSLHYSMLN